MESPSERLAANLNEIYVNIDKALIRSGRTNEKVNLIAVTKTVDAAAAMVLYALGATDFGENKVQELMRKREAFAEAGAEARWHMIGRLQRNKVKYLINHTAFIQSVDSLALLGEIEKESRKADTVTDVLAELNISGESTKAGFPEEAVPQLMNELPAFPHIRLRGFMTMAPFVEPELARPVFRKTRMLFEKYSGLDTLSMGMSNDYVAAVEEGATMVRLGSVLFK